MKKSEKTSQREWNVPKKQTHKQQLASEYNFMLFRITGAYCAPPMRRELPVELTVAYTDFNRARKTLINRLRRVDTRKKFMNLNERKTNDFTD